jgi:hypothetical protein
LHYHYIYKHSSSPTTSLSVVNRVLASLRLRLLNRPSIQPNTTLTTSRLVVARKPDLPSRQLVPVSRGASLERRNGTIAIIKDQVARLGDLERTQFLVFANLQRETGAVLDVALAHAGAVDEDLLGFEVVGCVAGVEEQEALAVEDEGGVVAGESGGAVCALEVIADQEVVVLGLEGLAFNLVGYLGESHELEDVAGDDGFRNGGQVAVLCGCESHGDGGDGGGGVLHVEVCLMAC